MVNIQIQSESTNINERKLIDIEKQRFNSFNYIGTLFGPIRAHSATKAASRRTRTPTGSRARAAMESWVYEGEQARAEPALNVMRPSGAGVRVAHDIFGEGLLFSRNANGMLTIDFDDEGVRDVTAGHVRLVDNDNGAFVVSLVDGGDDDEVEETEEQQQQVPRPQRAAQRAPHAPCACLTSLSSRLALHQPTAHSAPRAQSAPRLPLCRLSRSRCRRTKRLMLPPRQWTPRQWTQRQPRRHCRRRRRRRLRHCNPRQ